jgi:hypothetical protein
MYVLSATEMHAVYITELLGNKIETKIYMEKSPLIWRSKQPRGTISTINRKVQVTERTYIYKSTIKHISRHISNI